MYRDLPSNGRSLEEPEIKRTRRTLNPLRHKRFLAGNWAVRTAHRLGEIGVLAQVENAPPIGLPPK